MFLLELYLEKMDMQDRTIIWYLLTLARIQYAKYWRQEKIPTVDEWRQSIIQTMELDKISRKLKEQGLEKYEQEF